MKLSKLKFYLLFIFIVLLVIFANQNTVFADDYFGNVKYRIDGETNEATITGMRENLDVLEIPSDINGVTVTRIGYGAFEKNNSLKTVILPSTIKEIEESAFNYCQNLENVVFSDNITVIERYAFCLCRKLKNPTLPKKLERIGDSAFATCGSICGTLTIPEGVTTIESNAFASCNIENVILPETLITINSGVFQNCFGLKSINFPSSLKTIGAYSFQSCFELNNIAIPKSVEEIGGGAFRWCGSLTNLTIDPDNEYFVCDSNGAIYDKDRIKLIRYGKNESIIENAIIPEGIQEIGELLFDGFSNIKSVQFPSSLRKIGRYSFAGTEIKSIVIPSNVREIDSYAFSDCEELTNVTMQNGVTKMGTGVFEYCNKLQNVTFSNTLTNIGENAFYECESLTSLTIPESTEKIGGKSFAYCKNLTNIEFLSDYLSLGVYSANAFLNCENLQKVVIHASYCDFIDDNYSNDYKNFVGCPNVTLYGRKDSGVEEYAKENGINFVLLEEENIAHTHNWDNGKITKSATYDTEGVKTYTCTTCGATKTEKIAKLTKTSIEKASVKGMKSKTYNGKKQTQSLTIKLGSKTLKEGTDYFITYKSNKNVGTAIVVITGKGAYTGIITKTFKINPKGTSLKKLVAGKKQFKATWKAQKTQTSGYEVEYSTNKNFKSGKKTVKIKKNKTTTTTVKKLKDKKKYYVRIRTYKTVKGKTYYSGWSAVKNVTTKK